MAEAVVLGVETDICLDPNDMGCAHSIGVHSIWFGGCTYIGAGGWCMCAWSPERSGAAELLEYAIAARYATTGLGQDATG